MVEFRLQHNANISNNFSTELQQGGFAVKDLIADFHILNVCFEYIQSD